MDNLVIKTEKLSKSYKLYNKNTDRFKEAVDFRGKKYHENFVALQPISLEIKKGETVGILGKNGSGKSTLLKMITGVLSPTSGNVRVQGRISALLELGGGFNLELTGIENIYLNGAIMGFTRKEMEEKITDILNFAEIGDFVYQPVKMYSSGMFARLAFALAINVQPDILIVDEALAVGDIRFQSKCFEKFKELKKKGVTILFVSHDVQAVRNFCDHAIWINEGKLMESGDTVTVASNYIEFMNTESEVNNSFNESATRKESSLGSEGFIDTKESEFNPIKRWGRNIGLIKYAEIFNSKNKETKLIEYGEKVTIKIIFQADLALDINTLSVAFSIKNVQGIDVIVATTFDNNIMRIEKKGGLIEVEFEFVNYLNSGDYVLVVALEDRSQSLPSYYDFIEGAQYFKVLTKNQLFGIVNIPVEKSINYI